MTARATSPGTGARTAPCWCTSWTPTSHWRRQFGRDDFEYGQFGENFTVDGLPDDEVCIGDQYEIGEAPVRGEPTAGHLLPGRPAARRAATARRCSCRTGDPGSTCGCCARGTVEAGDPIVRVRPGPERMTVADVDALLYLPGHDRDDVARALRIPALSPGWQGSFEALLPTGQDATGNVGLNDDRGRPTAAWSGFRPTRVVEVVRETDTVVSLRLAAADGQALPAALPGQFVTLRAHARRRCSRPPPAATRSPARRARPSTG